MVFTMFKIIAIFIPNKVIDINKNIDKTLSENAEKSYTYLTKLTGATGGGAGVSKGSIDLAESIA